jgi:hypothetical protein
MRRIRIHEFDERSDVSLRLYGAERRSWREQRADFAKE